jgi:hypothetical protein
MTSTLYLICKTCEKFNVATKKVSKSELVTKKGEYWFNRHTKDFLFYCEFCEHKRSITIEQNTRN